MCSTCKGFHPTSLHTNVPKPKGKPGTSPKNSSMDVMSHHVNTHKPGDGGFCDSHSLIVPVWLYQRGYPEKKELVYALLDNQSDACFVTEEILQKLQYSSQIVETDTVSLEFSGTIMRFLLHTVFPPEMCLLPPQC